MASKGKGGARRRHGSSPRTPPPAVNLGSSPAAAPAAPGHPPPAAPVAPSSHPPPTAPVAPPGHPPPVAPAAPPRRPHLGPAPYPTWWPDSSSGINGSPPSANPWGFVPGGFVNLLQQPPFPAPPQPTGENFHFVGGTSNITPPSPATTPTTRNPNASIDIDDDDDDDGVEASKRVRRRFWSHDEEVKLASAWLNTSKDPIHGNDRKTDSFWGQITEEYNRNTPSDRRRDTNQLKCHWKRLSGQINEFNGYWSTVCKLNKSGYSDDQLMDEAQQKFQKKNGKPFSLVHWWRILKNEPKWCTHVAQMEKERNKTTYVDIPDAKEERPMGREQAKQQRKRKSEEVKDGMVILGGNINKIIEVTEERKKERAKVTEEQLQISRAALEVAKEKKEVAKEKKEAKFLEAYAALLVQDITNMSEEAKASREKTLLLMQKKLAANYGET